MGAKGSSKYGDDVIVYSPEYWKRYREANKEKAKAARDKYKLKQRQAYLAVKLSQDEDIPIAQALEEVGAGMKAVAQLKDKWEKEGRITKTTRGGDGFIPTDSELTISPDPPNPLVLEKVKLWGVPYDVMYAIMFSEEFNTAEAWEEQAKKWKSENGGKEENNE